MFHVYCIASPYGLLLTLTVHVQLVQVIKHYGPAWAKDKLIPAALSVFQKSTNYLHRITLLEFAKVTCSCCCSHQYQCTTTGYLFC